MSEAEREIAVDYCGLFSYSTVPPQIPFLAGIDQIFVSSCEGKTVQHAGRFAPVEASGLR